MQEFLTASVKMHNKTHHFSDVHREVKRVKILCDRVLLRLSQVALKKIIAKNTFQYKI